jgi:hypothetical protein
VNAIKFARRTPPSITNSSHHVSKLLRAGKSESSRIWHALKRVHCMQQTPGICVCVIRNLYMFYTPHQAATGSSRREGRAWAR